MRPQQVLSITLLSFLGLGAIAQPLLAAAAKESTNDDVLITGSKYRTKNVGSQEKSEN